MSTAAKFSDFHVLVMPVIAEEKIVAPKPTMVDRIPHQGVSLAALLKAVHNQRRGKRLNQSDAKATYRAQHNLQRERRHKHWQESTKEAHQQR
nr:hypothetical protein [Bifidobacterium catenulatum]